MSKMGSITKVILAMVIRECVMIKRVFMKYTARQQYSCLQGYGLHKVLKVLGLDPAL